MSFKKTIILIGLAMFIVASIGCAHPKSCVQTVKGAEQVETD